jgi:hypothetical protein
MEQQILIPANTFQDGKDLKINGVLQRVFDPTKDNHFKIKSVTMENYQETKEEALQRVRMANKHDYNQCFNFAVEWVKLQFKVFSANDFKKAYLEKYDLPQQVNIFGAVFSNLAREGLIFKQGAINSTTPESKSCLIRTWISLQFKQRQAQNASNKTNLKLEL